jgi:hypothetical protein
MRLGLKGAWIAVRLVLLFKTIHNRPRNMLQNPMENDILASHGLGPFSCPVDSKPSGIE